MIDLTGIKTLTICSSSKFYDTVQALAKKMTDAGLDVFTPRFDFNEEVIAVTMDDKIRLTRDFLRKIDASDAIYVIDRDGYTGRSVCIEIGYASALGKTVVLSELPVENAVRALTSEVVAVDEITKRIRPRGTDMQPQHNERRAVMDRMTEDASVAGLYSSQPEDYAAALKKARKRAARRDSF
jgi:nucleoside 2-deoxyribosyltransferase